MAEVRNFRKCKVAEFRVNVELLAAQQVVKVNLHKTRVSTLQNLPKILANFFASDHIQTIRKLDRGHSMRLLFTNLKIFTHDTSSQNQQCQDAWVGHWSETDGL